MSTIETPPEERLPIQTTVAEYDETLIRQAILREMDRGGQVFFVHNRVRRHQPDRAPAASDGARGQHRHRPRPDAGAGAGDR